MAITGIELDEQAIHDVFIGKALSVVAADGAALEAIRKGRKGELGLTPPIHVSDSDLYLVLPEDLAVDFVEILRDGDEELLAEAMHEGVLARGIVSRPGSKDVVLAVDRATTPAEVLATTDHYFAEMAFDFGDRHDVSSAVKSINASRHLQCTMASGLFNAEGLAAVLGSTATYIGASWQHPQHSRSANVADATYVWSRTLEKGGRGIELAVFSEYDELIAFVRPMRLRDSAVGSEHLSPKHLQARIADPASP
jgi:hypothetical protein